MVHIINSNKDNQNSNESYVRKGHTVKGYTIMQGL